MKKFAVVLLIAMVGIAFTIPAMAVEHEFGGYWYTRAYSLKDFSGSDEHFYYPAAKGAEGTLYDFDKSGDLTNVDTRTRLYYTAKLNENLKFVNKFEFNATWGDEGYGDLGADGLSVLVKNTYADFNLGAINAKIGAQGLALGRGFIMDDDFIGAILTYKSGNITLPFVWIKQVEGFGGKSSTMHYVKETDPDSPNFGEVLDEDGNLADGKEINEDGEEVEADDRATYYSYYDSNDNDIDWYAVTPTVSVGKDITVSPYVIYGTGKHGASTVIESAANSVGTSDFTKYFVGVDVDVTAGPATLWCTGIYSGGEFTKEWVTHDIAAYLLALGGSVEKGNLNFHGQLVYASGDDDNDDDPKTSNDTEDNGFDGISESYYWAEIMGYGTFDAAVSDGSPADSIEGIMFANVGASMNINKVTVGADLWYAKLTDDNKNGDDYLGTEIDLKLTYELVENLNLEVVAAYLMAGDATINDDPTDADGNSIKEIDFPTSYTMGTYRNTVNPFEIGTQLSLSF